MIILYEYPNVYQRYPLPSASADGQNSDQKAKALATDLWAKALMS
jgi:hypothetical protein